MWIGIKSAIKLIDLIHQLWNEDIQAAFSRSSSMAPNTQLALLVTITVCAALSWPEAGDLDVTCFHKHISLSLAGCWGNPGIGMFLGTFGHGCSTSGSD